MAAGSEAEFGGKSVMAGISGFELRLKTHDV
jgi:hypothetical protein